MAKKWVNFQVDAELKEEMDKHTKVNWSEVLRLAIRKELNERQTKDES
jgi:post-segregation antitoxin (ccd killing protein)